MELMVCKMAFIQPRANMQKLVMYKVQTISHAKDILSHCIKTGFNDISII